MGANPTPFLAAAAALPALALIALPAASVAATNRQTRQARQQSEEEKKRQDALLAGLRATEAATRTQQARTGARNVARRRQRSATTAGQGRADTILTSPLGTIAAPAQTATKTLLGA